jgi:tRNA pseudouridine55 synthase
MKVERRNVDGILLLDKPAGLSSNAALQQARRLFRAEKAGHTGTLDPLAQGLLPICFGEATKFAHALLDAAKTYVATIRFGATTTTGDAEGEVLEQRPVAVTRQGLEAVLQRFIGRIAQLPPRYAALKYQGRAYYHYARAGIEIPRQPREVDVTELVLEAWHSPEARVRVRCGKGTYVRVLAEDIGLALGCGAHLAGLRRVASGAFGVADAQTLDALAAATEFERDSWLLPVDALVTSLPRLDLGEEEAVRLQQGQALARSELPDGDYRAYAGGSFIGIAARAGGTLCAKRLLATAAGVSAVVAAGVDTAAVVA